MGDERVFLTTEAAEAMLRDGEVIHTFRSAPGIVIGADMDRIKLVEAFKKYPPELSGEAATAMKHGIVIQDDHGYLFVETKEAAT